MILLKESLSEVSDAMTKRPIQEVDPTPSDFTDDSDDDMNGGGGTVDDPPPPGAVFLIDNLHFP